jgi:hypothetical protein
MKWEFNKDIEYQKKEANGNFGNKSFLKSNKKYS